MYASKEPYIKKIYFCSKHVLLSVTPFFIVSYPNFFKLLFSFKIKTFSHTFVFIIELRPCRGTYMLILKVKLSFIKSIFLVTVVNFALLCELQNRLKLKKKDSLAQSKCSDGEFLQRNMH